MIISKRVGDVLKKKKLKIEKKDFSNILKRYMIVIIPVILIFFMLSNYVANLQIDKVKEIVLGEQKQSINTINYIINTKFEELKDDLFIIKNSDEMTRYVENSSLDNLLEAEQLIYRIASRKKNFCKVRFIDSNGHEIMKIVNREEKTIIQSEINMESQLDSKYYEEMGRLAEGDIYVSEMDLDTEKGKIEVPNKPVIRIATPIYYKGNYKGFIIINYFGSEILEIFNENFENSDFSFVEHVLVNKEGYYLYNNNIGKTFGFIFEDRKDYNMNIGYKELWDEMKESLSGEYELDEYIYYYRKIHPLEYLKNDKNYEWSIVTRFNMNNLPLMDQFILCGMKLSDILILLGICLLVLASIIIYYYKNKDEERLNMISMIVENISDATIITDKDTNIIFANKAFENTTGYDRNEIIGRKTNHLKSGLQSAKFYKKMWNDIDNEGYWTGELWDRKKDGMLYPKKLSILEMNNKNGEYRYLGIFNDLTQNSIEDNTVNKLKNYSLDTNFPSDKLLSDLFISSTHKTDKKIAVISFSVLNYNDLILRYGSIIDDKITDFINYMQKKNSSEKSGEKFIAKLSKNVFLIGISNIKNVDEVNLYVEKFFSRVDYINKKNDEIYFDVKAGISIFPRDGSTSEAIINNANLALEFSLMNSEIRYACYDSIVKENLDRELKIKSLLRKAIEKEELSLNYQPQLDLRNSELIGAEALLRWKCEELGSVSPSEFISLAEDIGIIKELGYWVIEKVFSDYHVLKEIVNDNFRISINLSSTQFNDENLIAIFKKFAGKYDMDLSRIEIELTESVFVKDVNMVNEKMKKFKNLGMTIAIDDFGTGFSSFSYLKQLSIDKIKIDRLFIKDYPNNDDGVIANVMTDMSSKLDMKIIAEGVDSLEQLKYLESINCFEIQGFIYSEPLVLDDLIKYIDEKSGNSL